MVYRPERLREAKGWCDLKIRSLRAMSDSLQELVASRKKANAGIARLLDAAVSEVIASQEALWCISQGTVEIVWSRNHLRKKLDQLLHGPHPYSHQKEVNVRNSVLADFQIFTIWSLLEPVLRMVLSNALSAAASQACEKVVEISAGSDPAGSRCWIEIRNSGSMSAETLKQIQQRRPVQKQDAPPGTGLLIANNMLDLLGGHMEIKCAGGHVQTRLVLKGSVR